MKYPPTDPETAATLLAEGEALRGLARSLLSREDPDDLLQDGYVTALARPDAPRQLGPWLTGTLRRLAARWRRRTARQTRREQLVARCEHDDASDPATIAAQAEATRLLGAAVHALDEPFRTVVVLRFWHGAKPATIARRLGVPVNTVRSRLQRALARLREALDERAGRRDAWAPALASLLPTTEPLLAPAWATTGIGAIAAIMTTKLLVGACLVLAALVTLPFVWPAPPAPAAVVATPSAPAAPALADTPEQLVTAPREAVEPRPLAPNSPTADEPPGAAPVVAPWTMHVVVVDEHGKAVPDALVWIWSGRLSRFKPHGVSTGNGFSGRTDEVLAKLLTDPEGEASATLDREMVYLRADKDATQSGEHWHSHVHPKHELQLMLRPRIPVAGRVVGVDGMPAAGAKVTVVAKEIDTRTLSKAPAPPALTTDDAGRFTCELLADFAYELQATHGEATSFAAKLRIARTPPLELVLTFPGAITLRGTVVGTEGNPIGGAPIRIWRDEPAAGDEEPEFYLTANADGQFSTPLRTHGRYSAMASPQDQARAEASAETSPVRPHAELRLVVPRFDTIRGEVKHNDGTPLVNARIHAEAGPITMAATAAPSVRERHVTGGGVALDGDGRFTLRVQPETTWALVVTPRGENRLLSFRREGIRSGTSDVVIVASDAELAGCTIRGRVLSPSGEPLTAYEVTLVTGGYVVTLDTSITTDGFEIAPIAIGNTVHVHVTPKDHNLTSRVFGPFVTSADGITIDARVELGAVLPVRVRESDGTPARAVLVSLNDDAPGERAYGPVPVGADGCVRLGGRVPGTRRIYLSREVTPVLEQEVVVLPGENPELVITLHPATTKPPR